MKRLLLFLLLLALGFLVLRLALGDELMAGGGNANAPGTGERTRPRPEPPVGEPIRVQQDGTELQVRGGFTIAPPGRRVPLPGGGVEFQRVYELTCRDCVPADGGRHRLDGVSMKLFDRGEHLANLTAASAIVEMQVDQARAHSLRESKEIELEDAVVTAVAGGRLPPLRIAVGRVRVLVDDEVVALHTPDENTPVEVVVDGERKGRLAGRGMRARMPKDRAAALGRLDLLILHQPTIAMDGVDLAATGQLHYVEQIDTGTAMLSVDGDVAVTLAGTRLAAVADPDTKGPAATTVRGDRLHGWLQRTRRAGAKADDGAADRDAIVWTMLRLLGSRAKVETPDLELESPRLTVLPGASGEMASITADGGPSALRQKRGGATFQSPRPIHLVRTVATCAAVHRMFGFPAFTLGPLQDLEIVTFDGASSVDAGDGVTVAADKGLHLFRQQSTAASGQFVARGFGNVVIAHGDGRERVEARGNSGFVLWRTAAGDEIVLGRDDPRADQQFALVQGDMRLEGNGAARLVRGTDGAIQVRLRSDRPTIGGTFGEGLASGNQRASTMLGRLRGADHLTIELRPRHPGAEPELDAFLAGGVATEVEFDRQGRHLLAKAARIERLDTNSFRLTSPSSTPPSIAMPADADGNTGSLRAPRIDIHRVAARSLMVDATAADGELARVDANLRLPGAAGRTVLSTTAQRLRLLPFVLGPAALPRHLLGLSPSLTGILTGSIGGPWLLADGDVRTELVDPEHGTLQATCHLLAASAGARSLLLLGDADHDRPAVLDRVENGERTVTATGARVRVVAETGGERIAVLTTFPGKQGLVPPTVQFRGAPAGEGKAGTARGWIRGQCRGEIEVLPDAVLFHGPVTANSLRPDGSDEPDGMQITAQQMQMARNRETGELVHVVAAGGVAFAWRRLEAHSRRVELDLRRELCIVEDPDGATLRLGALRFAAPRIEANYGTRSVRTFRGRLVHEVEPAARR